MLKASLVAAASLDLLVKAIKGDNSEYPDFSDAMKTHGGGNDWQSHVMTTAKGYNLVMFRIFGSSAISDTKGPLLFTHGMYSELLDWISHGSDPDLPAMPV